MRVGVPKETWPGETRVALIPAGVTQLKKAGLDVVVERDAGAAAAFPDTAYVQAGAQVVEDVRQPMLFIHAELDRQIPVSHVERLATLARNESKSKSVEVVTIRGVNHLLVPAVTGEPDEYASLSDLTVSRDITGAVQTWLTRTLPALRR